MAGWSQIRAYVFSLKIWVSESLEERNAHLEVKKQMRHLSFLGDGSIDMTSGDTFLTTQLAISTNGLIGTKAFSEDGSIRRLIGFKEGSQSIWARIWFSIRIAVIEAHPIFETVESNLDLDDFKSEIQSKVDEMQGKIDPSDKQKLLRILRESTSYTAMFDVLEQTFISY